MRLSSPAFDDGDPIPREYGYAERNVNPPLAIEAVPAEAVSLALLVDDPDAVAPAGRVWGHWAVWNVDPRVEGIPEGWDAGAAGAEEGSNDYGGRGYGGPNPPDRTHTYRFELLALDAELDLPPDAGADDVREAAVGHVVAEATLRGTFEP